MENSDEYNFYKYISNSTVLTHDTLFNTTHVLIKRF